MTPPSAASPPTTTRACTPRCSPRSPPPTAATRSPTARTSTPSGCSRLSQQHFGEGVEVFPVFNGTGANVTVAAVDAAPLGRGHLRVHRAHQHPTRAARPSGSAASSCSRSDARRQAHPRAHRPARPGAGATSTARSRWSCRSRRPPSSARCYTPTRSARSPTTCTQRGMKLHMDGARLSNAAAALGVPLRAFTRDAGVDVLSLRRHQERRAVRRGDRGAEPRGIRRPEVPAQAQHAARLEDAVRVGAAHRAARGRPVAAAAPRTPTPWRARLRAGVDAGIARACRARRQETQSNGVFAMLPAGVADRLRERASASTTGMPQGEVRWMCSFDTTEDDIDAFIAAIKRELAGRASDPAPGGEPAGLPAPRCIIFHCERTRPGSGRFPFCPGDPSTSTVPQ